MPPSCATRSASCRVSWRRRPESRVTPGAGRQRHTVTLVSNDARALAARALELGAVGAQTLSAREVIVDPRVNFKCRVPLCPSYGANLMCPPFVIDAREFAAVVDRYSECLVVQQKVPLSAADIKRRFAASRSTNSSATRPTTRRSRTARTASSRSHDARGGGARHGSPFRGGACRRRLLSLRDLRRRARAEPAPKSGAGVGRPVARRGSPEGWPHRRSTWCHRRGGRAADRVPGERRSALDRPAARPVNALANSTSERPA